MWRVRACLVILIPFFVFFQSVPSFGEVTSAEDYFIEGKQLVENNSGDNMGATKKGLEAGIKALENALEAGYPNIKEVYKLLGDAYNEIADERNPPEFERYMQKRKEVYDTLMKIAPDDPDVLDQFAMWYVKDKARKIEIYRRIIELDPKRVDDGFVLGLLLVQTGSVDEGVDRVGEAIAQESHFSAVRNYVERLIEALIQQGCPLAGGHAMEKKAMSMQMAEHSPDDKIREQAVEDMAQFKREIAGKLAKHKCLVKKK